MTQSDYAPEGQRPLIVHVVRQFIPNRGGLEDVVANLCRKLVASGFRVRVITLNSLFSDPGRVLPDRETIDGIDIVRIPWKGSTRYPVAPSVFRHLKDADLIHVHAIDFFFDALAWGWLLHSKPMVATTHGGFFHTKNHATIKKIWFNATTRLSSFAYRAIIGCSEADKRLFDTIASSKTRLIENGADTHKFENAASKQPQRRMITIGRFSSNKRIDHLLQTMSALADCGEKWHLDIVGVPSDYSEQDLQTLIVELGVETLVDLHIALPNPAISSLIGQASLFVSASEYEGFGLVAIEAMSAGLIPVLQPNDAYCDLAKKHKIVELADFSDPKQAATKLESVFSQMLSKGISLREEAVLAAQNYGWDAVSQKYIDTYLDVVPNLAPQI